MAETPFTPEQLVFALFLAALNMGIFCGLDARREGRSFLVWFAVGFFLTPYGILIWLFFRSNTRPTEGDAEGEKGEACARCDAPGRAEDAYCRACGEARGPVPVTPKGPEAGEAPVARAAAPRARGAGGAGSTQTERRYAVLTALSRVAARNPGLDLGDLVERARSARSPRDFDEIERELAERASDGSDRQA